MPQSPQPGTPRPGGGGLPDRSRGAAYNQPPARPPAPAPSHHAIADPPKPKTHTGLMIFMVVLAVVAIWAIVAYNSPEEPRKVILPVARVGTTDTK